jgi:hypothetical protein
MRAGFWAAAAMMIAMAVLLAVDGATAFAAGIRPIVYGLAMAAGAAAVVAATLASRVRVLPPMCVARLIEQVRPDLKNALLTFVELRSDPSADPSKIAAVARQAARILAEADFCEFVPTQRAGLAAGAAMGGACLLGVMLWLTQGVLFNHGPAAAEAGLLNLLPNCRSCRVGALHPPFSREKNGIGGCRVPTLHIGQQGLLSGGVLPVASSPQPQAGPAKTAKPPSASPQEKSLAEAAARSLAAALEADKEKLEKLAAALDEEKGAAPVSGGMETGAVPFSGGAKGTVPFSQQREKGTAPFAAPGVGSGVRPNEEKRVSPGESAAGQAPSAGDAGQAPSEGGAGQAPGEGAAGRGSNADDAGQAPSASDGGGAPGDGATKPPPAQVSAPPLPKRPQSDSFSEKTLDAMRKVRRLIDEADKRLSEGEVSDGFLGRMGMSNAEFRRFVAGWQRQIETASRETMPAPSAMRPAPGGPAPKLEFSPGGGGIDARPISGLAPSAAAIQGGAVQGTGTGVSVRLRPAVAAYFDKVGKLAAEKAETKATP